MAQGYEDRFGQLYPFFHETLELSPYDARECAMALCASLSQGSMTALCESLAMKAGLPGLLNATPSAGPSPSTKRDGSPPSRSRHSRSCQWINKTALQTF